MADSLYGLSRYKPSASATNDSDSPDVYIDEVGTGQGSTDSSSSGLAKGIRVGANGKTIYQVRRRIDELTEGGLARFASFVSVDGEPSYTGPKGEIHYPPGNKVQLFHKYTGSGSDTRPGLEDSTYMSWDRISTGVSFNPSSGSSFGPGQLTIHRPIIVECGDSHYSSTSHNDACTEIVGNTRDYQVDPGVAGYGTTAADSSAIFFPDTHSNASTEEWKCLRPV
jgi:hypothetical protein